MRLAIERGREIRAPPNQHVAGGNLARRRASWARCDTVTHGGPPSDVFRVGTKCWQCRDQPDSLRGVETARLAHAEAMRVAVLADVHGNAVALATTSEEVVAAAPDLLVFLGDVTWGPLPEETWGLVRTLCGRFTGRTGFVRGNAERALSE